jgi:hypothetical protein
VKTVDSFGHVLRHRVVGVVLVMLALATATACIYRPTSADAATPTDVLFLFDTSGSMAGELEEAALEMQSVMTRIDAVVPEVDYGVAEVRDYGGSAYDELAELDVPWRLVTPITSDRTAVNRVISTLSAAGGGDNPEAYGRALWESDTNPLVGWRPGARHAIVLVADDVPHMPDVDLGMPEALWHLPAPWDTGEELPGAWGISGTQATATQKTEFLEVLHQLASDGKPLEMVDYHDTGVNYIHYWEYWASLAGGHALEAGGGGKELAGKLISLIETAAPPCATTATPTVPSPVPPNTRPTALTPRFGAPATQVTIVPATGTRFCPGEHVAVGGAPVSSFEESTPAQMTFRVPPGATGGITVSEASGASGPPTPYEVDNFRLPWGFSFKNYPGTGGGTYDGHIDVTEDDLNAVFANLGPANSDARRYAKKEAQAILDGGLCYGFGLISKALYANLHGTHGYPMGWSDPKALGLNSTSTPYSLKESSSGSHAPTHALLRAALSQLSQPVVDSKKPMNSAKDLRAGLDKSFGADQPAMLQINLGGGEAHMLLAFNYQVVGSELVVDVVDPNLPWTPGRPPTDFDGLQVHVQASGAWSYSGSFPNAFDSRVVRPSGTLLLETDPPVPTGLPLVPSRSSGAGLTISPGGGQTISDVSYSSGSGHGLPEDIEGPNVAADAGSDSVVVPSDHHTVTATTSSKSGDGTSTFLVGPGFIDLAEVPEKKSAVTVSTQDGAIEADSVPSGTTLSVTSVSGEVQQAATVTFFTRVRQPEIKVGKKGGVTVTTAGGTGRASIKLAAFAPGHVSRAPKETVRIQGRTKVTRQVPKVKHRKHKRAKKHRHAKG